MNLLKHSIVTTVWALIFVSSTQVNGQPNWVPKHPKRPSVRVPKFPNFKPPRLSSGSSNHSHLTVEVPPSLDSDGNIWYGGSNPTAGKGSHVVKLRPQFNNQGRAYFASSYRNEYGSVEPSFRWAPQFDKPRYSPRPAPQRIGGPVTTFGKTTIDPYTGEMYRMKFVNGFSQGRQSMGYAQLQFSNGRPYYTANGVSVWKARPGSNTLLTRVDPNGNVVYRDGVTIAGMNGNDFSRLNDGQKLGAGIAHIITELINNN